MGKTAVEKLEPDRGEAPLLSVVLVVGSQRDRASRVVRAVSHQTVVDALELVIVDLASGSPPLSVPAGLSYQYFPRPGVVWSDARAEAVHHARAPVVAFIEDHCFPTPGWAEALLEAHQGPWGAVGYAFTNANPETYWSRAALVTAYGPWLAPARRGPAIYLPGNNVSYKRALLLSFGDQLPALLTPDFNLQEALARRGVPMTSEPTAVAAHENFTCLLPHMRASYAYARLLAARRVQARRWRWRRRFLQAVGTPLGGPLLGSVRLVRSVGTRRGLRRAVAAALPVYLFTHAWSALGETIGYVAGEGSVEKEVLEWELNAARRSNT